MLRSMTGFGRAQASVGNGSVTVMVRTLNNKQLDLSVKLPFRYRERENQIRDIASKMLQRGKIDISISLEDVANTEVSINRALAEKYHQEMLGLSAQLNIKAPENWLELLMRMPEVVGYGSPVVEDEEWKGLMQLVQQACEETDVFRKAEAEALGSDMMKHLDVIQSLLPEIERFDPERKAAMHERLQKELKQSLPDIKADESRLEQELFYYIDKLDITEEKVRLANHIVYFRETLQQENGEPAGKKLGFIAQEIGREINTLGNKSNYFEIQRRIVEMKDELEKIKEQLANIL